MKREFLSKQSVAWPLGLITMALTILVQSGCSEVEPNEYLSSGRQLLNDGDISGAVVELKNAVQGLPKNVEARLLLGQAYLESNDPASALKEFKRARTFGASDENLNLNIVRALINSGKIDEAATELALNAIDGQGEWLFEQARLDLAVGRFEEARGGFEAVLVQDPKHVEAQWMAARSAIGMGNPEVARADIDNALGITEENFQVWMLKGDLEKFEKNYADASDAYTKALELEPGSTMALMARAAVRATMKNAAGALADLDAMGPISEEDPRTVYLRALIARQQDNSELALRYLRQVLQVHPTHFDSLGQAASIHFVKNEMSAAEDYLNRMLEIDPSNARANKMMQAVRLRSGQISNALGEIESVDVNAISDPEILSLLGTAFLKHGKIDESQKSFERANELDPESVSIRTQLAMSNLRKGNIDAAETELAKLRADNPDLVLIPVLQAVAQMMEGNPETAMQGIDDLIKSNPDSPVLHNVRGYLLGIQGDINSAKVSFSKALEIDPAMHPANFNLARIAVKNNDYVLAKTHMEQVIAQEPNHLQATLNLANLAEKDGHDEEALAIRTRAYEHHPDRPEPRIALARHYRRTNMLEEARTMATEAYDLASYSPGAQYEYVLSSLQSDDPDSALPVALEMAKRFSDSREIHELLARTYNRVGDAEAFKNTLISNVERFPESRVSKLMLARIYIGEQAFSKASAIAKTMVDKDESRAMGLSLNGDIAVAQGQHERAFGLYRDAQELAPASVTILKMLKVARAAKKDTSFVDEWLQEHPDDALVRITTATVQLAEGGTDRAIDQYETVLKTQPNNVIALNNLAWLYDQKEDDRALEFARKAHEIAPERAEVVDTYGWITLRRGNLEQAVGLLYRAVEKAPDNRDIRFHLASALAASEDEAAAAVELKKILSDEETFEARGDAEALLKTLQN